MAQRFVMPIQSTFDDSGLASSGDKANFYSTGTSTRKDTFSDSALTSANANPVVADSSGRFADIFLESGDYKVVLTDSADVETWTADPVAGAVGTSGVVDEKTGAYTVTIDDATKIIACDASGGAFTVTLLAAATAGDGFEITVKKTDASANAVTVDANGAETIDGETTYILSGRQRSVSMRSDGTNWQILSIGTPAKPDVQAKTTTYPVVVSDDGSLIDASASGGAFTVTLPTVATAGDGFIVGVKKTDTSTNAVTVDGNGSETIDTLLSIILRDRGDIVWLRCDGTKWHIDSKSPVMPRGHIDGLTLTRDTDTDHDINVAVGGCRAQTDAIEMAMVATGGMTKRIDATWAAGDDAGGLSSSLTAPANTTWYHFFSIIVAGAVDYGFDTSVTAANLIADHSATAYRRIGSVLTNGSANITAFTQVGDRFNWDAAAEDATDFITTTQANTVISVPTGLRVEAIIRVRGDYNAGTSFVRVYSPDGVDATPTAADALFTVSVGSTKASAEATILTDTSAQVRWDASAALASSNLNTVGWFDPRGRND